LPVQLSKNIRKSLFKELYKKRDLEGNGVTLYELHIVFPEINPILVPNDELLPKNLKDVEIENYLKTYLEVS